MVSKITTLMFCLMVTTQIFAQNKKPSTAETLPDKLENVPVNLLDEKLSYWYKWLGVPYRGITNLPAEFSLNPKARTLITETFRFNQFRKYPPILKSLLG